MAKGISRRNFLKLFPAGLIATESADIAQRNTRLDVEISSEILCSPQIEFMGPMTWLYGNRFDRVAVQTVDTESGGYMNTGDAFADLLRNHIFEAYDETSHFMTEQEGILRSRLSAIGRFNDGNSHGTLLNEDRKNVLVFDKTTLNEADFLRNDPRVPEKALGYTYDTGNGVSYTALVEKYPNTVDGGDGQMIAVTHTLMVDEGLMALEGGSNDADECVINQGMNPVSLTDGTGQKRLHSWTTYYISDSANEFGFNIIHAIPNAMEGKMPAGMNVDRYRESVLQALNNQGNDAYGLPAPRTGPIEEIAQYTVTQPEDYTVLRQPFVTYNLTAAIQNPDQGNRIGANRILADDYTTRYLDEFFQFS